MSAVLSKDEVNADTAAPAGDGPAVAVLMTEVEAAMVASVLTEVIGLLQAGGGADNNRGRRLLCTLREHRALMARASRGEGGA